VTLRQIVHISLGGQAVRVKFSNVLGTTPFTIDAASVGVRATGATVARGTLRELTFGRLPSITLPPGAVAVSDPVDLRVDDEADLAISLFVAAPSTPTSQLTLAHQTSYVSGPGDWTGSRAFAPASTFTSWYWLTGVEVRREPLSRAVVAFGDSITEGFNSTTDANARWPDVLARRLLACRGSDLSVVNEAISGNRVLNDEIGPNAQARLDRDLIAVTNVGYAILLEGINDIGFSQIAPGVFPPNVLLTDVSAEEIIQGYEQIIRRAHARGIRIYGGTLLPFVGAAYQDAAAEVKRETVNFWIRTSGAFDAVIDFDAATRDPANPLRLNPAYDSGDHLHPNDAGYAAMGRAFDRGLFGARHCN
jgi:lysophospholipase L1-like esterase